MSLIGLHVSISGGFLKAIERGKTFGCEAIQIFTKNQLQWKAPPISPSQGIAFLKALRESGIRQVVAHASYLINLAAEGDQRRRSLEALIDEIDRCDQLGIGELVLHPGAHLGIGAEKGIANLLEGLRAVLDRTSHQKVRILLETMAGQGTVIGARLEEFRNVLEGLDWHERLGLCLDTCHLFAAGYELRERSSYEHFARGIERTFGLRRIGCWHLNDSRTEKGSLRDRHQHLGDGELGLKFFSMLLNDGRWEDVPLILETPKDGPGDARNMALLRKLRGH
ncbi:MAG: deoxyribonuclease IV [Synergistaceae bacterium]|nr:deoxyribonuclease IV [Synergistaceae bacterium]